MYENTMTYGLNDERSETRKPVNKFYNIVIVMNGDNRSKPFRVWDIGQNSISFLVEPDSPIIDHFKIGKKLNIIYFPLNTCEPCLSKETILRYVTKISSEKLNGQHLVGLEFIKRDNLKLGLKGSLNIHDNGGRRFPIERRKFFYDGYIPERRSGKEQRKSLDRRGDIVFQINGRRDTDIETKVI